MSAGRLWTIGYEASGQPDFLDALREANVSLLVDVRDVANSRRAGFAKNALREGLAGIGVGYMHLKALGTPKAGRDAHRRGDIATFRKIYCEAIERPEAQLALREAADLIREARVCLMCFEADWRFCHRAEIADRLQKEHGLDVTHLHV